MQRPAHLAGSTLGIENVGLGQRIGRQFDDGVEHRATVVDGGDAVQVGLGQLPGIELAPGHAPAGFGHVELDDVDGGRAIGRFARVGRGAFAGAFAGREQQQDGQGEGRAHGRLRGRFPGV